MKRTTLPLLAAAATAALVLSACSSTSDEEATADASTTPPTATATAEPEDASTDAGSESDSDDTAAAAVPGRYVEYAAFSEDSEAFANSDVVLFFHAAWCPKCRETEENINADGLADGLTVVKVDFDSSTDLRQQYGVTLQHTFVQIDESGAEVAKWNGSFTPDDIAAKTV